MPAATIQYVYFSGGPHQRQPTRTGPGGFTLIASYPLGDPTTGSSFGIGKQPSSQTVNGITYPFSFVTVSNGSTGVHSFDSQTPPPSIAVGNAPITAVVVYVTPSGTAPGATVDEFDLSTGLLLNDTFVTVTPDSGNSLTNSGNVEGFVPTANSAENIVASLMTLPSIVDFYGWVTLGPPASMSTSPTLAVGKGQSVAALAFYQAPPANLGTIVITVYEDSDGGITSPVSAAVSAPGLGEALHSPDGTYVFTNAPPGVVTISAVKAGATTGQAQVTVIAGQTVNVEIGVTKLGTKF